MWHTNVDRLIRVWYGIYRPTAEISLRHVFTYHNTTSSSHKDGLLTTTPFLKLTKQFNIPFTALVDEAYDFAFNQAE